MENFNKSNGAIHKHHHHHRNKAASVHGIIDYNPNIILKSNYHFNYFLNQETNHFPLYEHRWKMLQNIANVSKNDDKNFTSFSSHRKKEMEADQLSTASSTTTTNFTGNLNFTFHCI